MNSGETKSEQGNDFAAITNNTLARIVRAVTKQYILRGEKKWKRDR